MIQNLESRNRIRRYMNIKEIDPLDPKGELSVQVVRPDIAPVTGSAHIALGRVIPTKRIESILKRRFFRFF